VENPSYTKQCLFNTLVDIYLEDLFQCETKITQRWRTSGRNVVDRIELFIPLFS